MVWFEAHPVSWFILIAGFLVPSYFLPAVYVFSGASVVRGWVLGLIWLFFGAGMFCVCLYDVNSQLGPIGNLVIPVAWLLPSIFLYMFRDWVLCDPLNQKWLVGLQLFRAIGAVFLIEMAREQLTGIFAWPAGVGDILVALIAAAILFCYRSQKAIDSKAVYFLITVGVLDFVSAFFFGFFSSDTPFRLFNHNLPNNPSTFPIGLIPLYLVPYAIFFHTLSWLNQRKLLNH